VRGSQKVREALFGSPLYQMTLGGRVPKTVLGTPPDPWPGNPQIGAALRRGDFELLGHSNYLGEIPWTFNGLDEDETAELHGFGWLRHLREVGSEEASIRARDLVSSWIAVHTQWADLPWRPDVLGERLTNWLANYQFIRARGDEKFCDNFMASMAKQARHLTRAYKLVAEDGKAFAAIRGLINSGLCLETLEENYPLGLQALNDALTEQIHPDGGHFQRNPSLQYRVLAQLIEIRQTLRAAHEEVPKSLQQSIEIMTPFLRSLRHGDGRLCLFNDSMEEDEAAIDRVMAAAESNAKPIKSAAQTGFQRIRSGRTLILVDAGVPPASPFDVNAHAGTLGFEMSVGKYRMVVNCGAHPDNATDWHHALRSTAAHSALVVDHSDSALYNSEGHMTAGPKTVTVNRNEEEGHTLVELSHDGYQSRFGLIHKRDLYLSPGGNDFRGLDQLVGTGGSGFEICFHLHPDVQALTQADGSGVLLRVPGINGGWRFRAAGGAISLKESIYHGTRAGMRRAEQIVISGHLNGEGATVKWAFKREAKG